MPEFNPPEYFNRRASELAVDTATINPNDGLSKMENTATRAKDALIGVGIRKQEALERNKQSLVGKLGLEADSTLGQAVNLGASLYSGLSSQVAGNIVSFLAGDLEAMLRDSTLGEPEIQAIGRYRQGVATEADVDLITARRSAFAHSPMEQANLADQARERSANINASFDRSGLIQTDNRDALSEQLGAGFQGAWDQTKQGASALWNGEVAGAKDLASGLGQLIFNAGEAAVSNPAAAREYIAENVPQLAVGAFGAVGKAILLTSNAGYASEEYQKGIAKYQAENGGAYPPEAQRREMAAWAASLALAEQVTDASLLKNIRGAAKAVEETGKIGLVQSTKNVLKAGAAGTAGEAFTEGYQTYAEGQANLTPVTDEQVYEGMVIGGLAGGGMSAGGRAAGEVLKATPEHLRQREAIQTRAEALDAAIATGDVTALTDPQNPVYSPEKAVAALFGNSVAAEATPESQQANLEKANSIVADLEEQRSLAQAKYDLVAPGLVEKYQAQLETAKAAGNTEMVSLLEEQLKDVAQPDPKAAKALELQISKLDKRLEVARETMTRFQEELQPKDLGVAVEADTINTPIDESDVDALASRRQAADRIINLSMAIPERLDKDTATKLAETLDNGLTGEQRSYLRAFSEARIAENEAKDIGKVTGEVLFGGSGNIGLTQYRSRLAQSLATGNQAQADSHLATLNKFATDHAAKAALVAQAWDDGPGNQVLKNKDGSWFISEQRRPYAEVRRNGGLTVNTSDLVTAIKAEADAITKTAAELSAAYALKFNTTTSNTTTAGVANVPDVSQAPRTTQVAAQPNPSVQGAASPVASTAAGRVAAPVGTTPAVGSTELVQPGVVPDADESQSIPVNSVDLQASPDAVPSADRSQGELQSTETVAQGNPEAQSESAEQTSPEVDGKITALSQKSIEGTEYRQRNLVTDNFTQSDSREGDATSRPLVKVKDFLSSGWDKAADFLQKDEIGEDQVEKTEVLSVFKEKATAWAGKIQGNLARKVDKGGNKTASGRSAYAYEDLSQFLLNDGPDGQVDFDENVKTGMAYAAFSWLAEQVGRSDGNSDEEINRILRRDETHPVEDAERDVLKWIGVRQNVAGNGLGQRTNQALGLSATKDAKGDLGPRMDSAMGAHVVKLLTDLGYVQRTTLTSQELAAMAGATIDEDDGALHHFLTLARDAEGKVLPEIEEIFRATMGTQGVLDKLFSVESSLKAPTFEPVKFTQTKTAGTNQNVPTKLAEIMERENAVANYVREDMFFLVDHLDDNIVLQIAGAKTVDPTETHLVNRAANEAKNNGLRRELDRFKDFVATMKGDLEKPIYFEHTVWMQQRVGISTNLVNPQTSKIHRHMLFRKTWETKVDRNNDQQMENFTLRVAEGLGVKTDKQDNVKSLADAAKKIADPSIQAAVAVLQKRLEGAELSQSEQEVLLAGVQTGGEKFHSLDALMALAHEARAKSLGNDTFTVHLMGEVDGVTNGPMLSHLLMGAAKTVKELFGLLNRGGFFEQGNEHSQYNQWRGLLGNFDLYETTAGHMVKAVQKMMDNGIAKAKGQRGMPAAQVSQVMGAIYSFTGTLADKDGKVEKDGRNIIKTPLTAMVFGSSLSKSVDSMAFKFIESIYAGIEKMAQQKPGALKREDLIENLNLLLSQGGASMVNPGMSVKGLMEFSFSKEQVEGLKRTFKNTLGAAVRSTMEEDFAPFIEQRRMLNLAAQTTFELYNAVYKGIRDEYVQELIASGEIAVNEKTGKPLHEMTAAQEAVLRKRLAKIEPLVHTLMSKDSGSLRAGLAIAKSGRRLSDNPTFTGTVKFGTGFADSGAMSSKTRAFESFAENPGVAMAVLMTHSLDSAISHYAMGDTEVLNVHDAHGAGLATFQQTAQNLNKATWNAVLNYSPASEMVAAMERTVTGLAAMMAEGNLPPSVAQNLSDAIAKLADKSEMEAETFLTDIVAGMKEVAFKADNTKLEALETMQAIDQYALEGGNYEVTQEDRDAASALRAGLSSAVAPATMEAVEKIQAALTKSDATEARPMEEDAPPAKPSPFGTRGQSTKGDAELVAFFQENPNPTARQVMEVLFRKFNTGNAKGSEFNLKLLRALVKTVNPNLKFKLIDGDTQVSDVAAMPKTPSLGWFTSKGGQDEIYIVGPDFAQSQIVPELLLHELTHAATAYRLTTRAGERFVMELEILLEEARDFVKANGLSKFDTALTDIDELVAYGMTSKTFQNEVLAKVQMKANSRGLNTGLKTFIDLLARLLGFKDADAANGLGTLITNVAGLLEQEANEQKEFGIQPKPMTGPLGSVQDYSTLDIHDALDAGNVSTAFDAQLRDVLGGIVEKLHGPFGAFKAALMQNQALTPMDVWQKALATGVAAFASSVQVSPITVSEREAHAMEQVEATMREVLARSETTSKSAYRELAKLYKEMSLTIKPADFASQAEYDFIFKLDPDANDRSNHLARFAAFGLAHEQFNKLMKVSTATRPTSTAKTFAERLQVLWENVLEFFVGELTKTFAGQQADQKLARLVGQLVDIEAKKKLSIARRAAASQSPMAAMESGVQAAGEYARSKVAAAAGSQWVRQNGNVFVQAAGGLARTFANDQVEWLLKGVQEIRDRNFKEKHGIVMGLLSDVQGVGKVNSLLALASTNMQRLRKTIITQTSSNVLKAFANNGKDMSSDTKAAITQVFMRTGMHHLVGTFSMQEIEGLIGNKPALDAAIATLEAQLTGFGAFKDHFIHQANGLAYFRVSGVAANPVQMMNAHNIARLYGTNARGRITVAQSRAAEPIIEKLVALYALGYVEAAPATAAKEVLRTENARTDGRGNGVEFVLALHKKLEQDSKARLFVGQEALAMHGYTPEIYNPHTDIQTANAVAGKELEFRGYTKGGAVPRDPADPDTEVKHIYVLKDGGLAPHLTGIFSYTGKNARGRKLHSGYMNVNTADGLANASLQADINHSKPWALAAGPRPDLAGSKRSNMVPVINPMGDVVNWRYVMQDSTKKLLDRDSSFERILGVHAGSIYDKESTTEMNTKAIQSLREVYNDQRATQSHAFVLVGPRSPDPELREIWSMLPDETKATARSVWSKDGMYVRKDALKVMFGYRKYSLAQAFDKEAWSIGGVRGDGVRNPMEELFVTVIEHSLSLGKRALNPGMSQADADNYAKVAANKIARGERIWQELVGEMKDIIVVKTGSVMMGNIYSNFSLLMFSGVPVSDIVRNHLVAYRGYRQYQADEEKAAELQLKLDTGLTLGQDAKVRRELALVKDSLARNPVAELIDAGLMPTIVEDVAQDDDIYSYKSELSRKVEGTLSKVNPTLLSAAKTVYMAHDTKLYQGLSRITQLSDFVARYTLYQHLTNRKVNPLSKEDAIHEASETFINYDIPMHSSMQYLDDMGITMFTKYFLRVQRVLLKLTRENPARVFMGLGLDQFLDLGPIVLDGAAYRKIGNNPFGSGALNLPSVLDEIMTVSSGMALIK